jgi:hypothetical protein
VSRRSTGGTPHVGSQSARVWFSSITACLAVEVVATVERAP